MEKRQIRSKIHKYKDKYKIQIAKYKMSKIYYLKKSCPIVEFSRFSTFLSNFNAHLNFCCSTFLIFFHGNTHQYMVVLGRRKNLHCFEQFSGKLGFSADGNQSQKIRSRLSTCGAATFRQSPLLCFREAIL